MKNLKIHYMGSTGLGVASASKKMGDHTTATQFISDVDKAITSVSTQRSKLGAVQKSLHGTFCFKNRSGEDRTFFLHGRQTIDRRSHL